MGFRDAPSRVVKFHRRALHWGALVVLAGCTTTVDLNPKIAQHHVGEKFSPAVGVYFSPELRSFNAGETKEFSLIEESIPVGKASVALFKDVLPSMFEGVEEVSRRPTASQPSAHLAAVIEPRITHFKLEKIGTGAGMYWADVRYRLAVYGRDGREIAGWSVEGRGASGEKIKSLFGDRRADAIERALETAGARLAASFSEVPEAANWRRGRKAGGPAGGPAPQIAMAHPKDGGAPGRGHAGVAAVFIDSHHAPDFASENIAENTRNSAALSVNIAVRSVGDRRLLFRRSKVALVFPDGRAFAPVPGDLLAARMTKRKTRVAPVGNAGGAGGTLGVVVAIFNVMAGFHNYGVIEAETAETNLYKLILKKDEIADGVVTPGKPATGYVHFDLPPSRRAESLSGATLLVPVVALDTVTRYVVSLPLGTARIASRSDGEN
ncbi:MAG: hypothetical protein R3229_07735 [Alphaproteobacteria bacterium]|nr:hypothetical protein [Alphaproteobacteria bacterium]